MEEILRLFPDHIRQIIEKSINERWQFLQEIRFRLHQPIELIFNQKTEWIEMVRPDRKDCVHVINQLSEYSLYRMEDELRDGYITIEGGHRVGLAGKVNTMNGSVKAVQFITFLNIRIAKEQIGAAAPIIPYIYTNQYCNTLFVGPPQTGKTTLIRDTARLIASGWGSIEAKKVGIIDERSEIAASRKGVPQHNLGLRSDVMDACPKSEGMMMMIRSMSPEVLIVDEIGSKEDVGSLLEAINAGVTIICTIHGSSLDELKKRPSLKPLFNQQVFTRIIILERTKSPGSIHKIYDQNERNILKKRGACPDEMDWSTSIHSNINLGRV